MFNATPQHIIDGAWLSELLPGMEKYAEVAIKAHGNSTHRF